MPRIARNSRCNVPAGLVGLAIAGVGVWQLPDTRERDPRGLAVFDRPQTKADRQAARNTLDLADGLAKKTARPEDVRLLGGSGDGTATLVGYRRSGAAGSGDSGTRRFAQWCLVYGGGLAIQQCGDVHGLLRGEISGAGTSETTDPSDHSPHKPPPAHFYGVVPNAVKRVEATFSGGIPPASGSVANNFYDVVSTYPGAMNRNGPVRWLDASGKAVKH